MGRWTCPACGREFGRAHQAHTCRPAGSVDATFEGAPPEQRAIYDAIVGHVRTIGPVHEDAVDVGVFLKSDRKLAEIRPHARSLELALYLPFRVEGTRIRRVLSVGEGRQVHLLTLREVGDVDEQVRDWLTLAFLAASD
ncbi:MAG: hypothetical protein JO023_13435 [Chloroflexi bacterium]|nr:hypothetical protein [Chloroflexota bacterium]